MKVAMLTPLPPSPSGIADYAAELIPALSRICDLTVYSDDSPPKASGLTARPIAEFAGTRAGGFDVALYQLGNSLFHEAIYRAALCWPGVSAIHDPVMQHFISAITERRGDGAAYFREMLASHGPAGAAAARRVLRGDGQIDPAEFPLTGRILDSSLRTIVHSQDAVRRLRRVRPDARIDVVPHLVAPPKRVTRKLARDKLGLKQDELLVGAFGLATPEKRIGSIVEALTASANRLPEWRFLIVGEDTGVAAAALESAAPGVRKRSQIAGRVDWDRFGLYQQAVDFAVALRRPTNGETSGAVLRLLARGVPVIVSDTGAFRELPDDAVLKVPADEGEGRVLAAAFGLLATDPEERGRRGRAARKWAAEELAPGRVAERYLAALQSAAG